MVRLALLLASVLALASCSSHCQELGKRLCQCKSTTTTTSECENSVKSDVQRANPGKDTEAECAKALDTCHPPSDAEGHPIDFCDFLAGRCGKSLCRISAESYCDADVCDGSIYCNPSLCGAGVVQIAEGAAPAICDPASCTSATACDVAVCPKANQSPSCTP